jgi:hypothetical protein
MRDWLVLNRAYKVLAIGLLVLLILVPTYVSFVSSSTGYIRINRTSASVPGQTVPVGGNVSLYFGEVTWSSSQLYLLLSHDLLPQLSPGDFIYTPRFSVYNMTNTTAPSFYANTYGAWVIGNNWINGSIPTNTPVGNYSVKAFDEVTSDVAVTDTFIAVYPVGVASLQASPSSGPGGAIVRFTGSGYPADRAIDISYYDPAFGSWNLWSSTIANASGQISFTTEMPDLRKSVGNGDYSEAYTSISFRAESAGVIYSSVNYNQYSRGLKRVGNLTASGLYGNGTNLSSVSLRTGDNLTLSGKWFHPGDVIYVRWDGVAVVGTVTGDEWRDATIIGESIASSSGSFDVIANIPTASAGEHYVAVEDSQTRVIIKVVASIGSLQISPSSGAGGVPVQFSGSGYPANSTVNILYSDPFFGTWNTWTSTTSDLSGRISFTAEMPDLKKSQPPSDSGSEFTTAVSFRTQIADIIYSYANYNQNQRGLKRIGPATASGLYGNGTSLISNVKVKVGDSVVVSGKWFHPGDSIYVRWDGVAVVGTVTGDEWRNAVILGTQIAGSTGAFNMTITIPTADVGEHYLAFEDSQTIVIVKILLSPGSLQISPSSGPGGAPVQFTGAGYPANAQVAISYLDPTFGTWNYWRTATADTSGTITFSSEAPDLGKSLRDGDSYEATSLISFRTEIGGTAYSYADFTQYYRGLKRVGSQTATGLYGNGTNLSSTVSIKTGDTLTISGKWFRPGVIYIRWDGVTVVGTVTGNEWRNAVIIGSPIAGSTGSFETSVTIPTANVGEHYLAIEDSQAKVIAKVYVNSPPPQPTQNTTNTTTNNSSQTTAPSTNNPSKTTPTIALSCKGTATSGGLKVEIKGNLSFNGSAIPGASILVSYSVTGGKSWESLTLVTTDSNGGFAAVWMPSVTGNYMVKAEREESSTMNEASTTVNLILEPYSEQNVFTMTSNSTITQFAFNSTGNELYFVASGPSGTTGYVNIYVPKSLIGDISNLKAYIDGKSITYNSESQTDSWLISFAYSHSEHKITLELGAAASFASNDVPLEQWLIYIIPIAVVAAVVVAAVTALKRKRRNKDIQAN